MYIDSKQLSGICSCGREHIMITEFCVIEQGCMARLPQYLAQVGLGGVSVSIYDENTYYAKGLTRPAADYEIILPADSLHADDHGVELLTERLPAHCDFLIAIGSGTVHDLTRYCAYTRGIPFVSCPTAASVDGFCAPVAAMTWHGFKKTLTAVPPKLVVADLDVIMQAPPFLIRSGFGDMIGKFIALADWKIGHLLTGEYFCDHICSMTMGATNAVLESAEGIRTGTVSAYEKLTYGLLMSGLAMQMIGNSRPASGAEHHISHLIEMRPAGLPLASEALHGEKVGVGTLLAAREYHRLRGIPSLTWEDYPIAQPELINAVFGQDLGRSIITENETDVAAGITAEAIRTHWDAICRIIDQIPAADALLQSYQSLSIKSTLEEIGVSPAQKDALLDFSPLVRNRLTLMRIRRAIKKEDNYA